MNKARITISFLTILIISLSIVQTMVSNGLSTAGTMVGKLDDQVDAYKTENLILSEKLFSASSLSTVYSEASDLGFIEGKSQYVVTSSLPLAIR